MGEIENKIKKQIRVGKVERTVLGVIYGAGIISLAVMAPNALQILGKVKFSRQQKNYVKQAAKRLREKGLVDFENTEKGTFLRTTKKGELFLAQATENPKDIFGKKKWDGKWRIVSYDIPEKKRHLRDRVRDVVSSFGFKKLHNSTWVFPYPAEDLIVLLKADLEIGKDVLYIVADEIENDKRLRKMFNLN